MFNYDAYNLSSKQQKIVIFLHGYNSAPADYSNTVYWLKEKIASSYLIVPQAPEISEKNPKKLQWFGMMQYDPDRKRSQTATPTDEIFAIYNKAQKDISERSARINQFIDQLQQKLNIDDQHTFLVGFSQGAMLAIYTALTRDHKLGGTFALSGLLAGSELLKKNIRSKPYIYLFHGENDTKVQYKTLFATNDWLKLRQIDTQIKTYAGLEHMIIEDEITAIAQKINETD